MSIFTVTLLHGNTTVDHHVPSCEEGHRVVCARVFPLMSNYTLTTMIPDRAYVHYTFFQDPLMAAVENQLAECMGIEKKATLCIVCFLEGFIMFDCYAC